MVSYGMGYGGMTYQKVAWGGIVGGLVGSIQTALLREYADNSMATGFLKNTSGTPPFLMKQLKGFGSPSAFIGIVAGAVALVVGLAGMLKRKIIHHDGLAAGLTGYGVTALTTGLISGALPTPQWQAATAADPNNPINIPAVQRTASPQNLQIQRAQSGYITLGA